MKEKFGLKTLDKNTLRSCYQRNGVRFRRADYKYFKTHAENKDLQKEQQEFVDKLGTIIVTKAYDEIIYIDETTFHLWQKMNRCWVKPDMKLMLITNRGPSITVIGAISEARGLVHFLIIDESNNANHFEDFLIGLKEKCAGKRILLILDNLKIHYAKKLN